MFGPSFFAKSSYLNTRWHELWYQRLMIAMREDLTNVEAFVAHRGLKIPSRGSQSEGNHCQRISQRILAWKTRSTNAPNNPQQNSNQLLGVSRPESAAQGSGILDKLWFAIASVSSGKLWVTGRTFPFCPPPLLLLPLGISSGGFLRVREISIIGVVRAAVAIIHFASNPC